MREADAPRLEIAGDDPLRWRVVCPRCGVEVGAGTIAVAAFLAVETGQPWVELAAAKLAAAEHRCAEPAA